MNFPAEPKIANWMKESRLSKVCRNTAVHCPAHHTTEGVKFLHEFSQYSEKALLNCTKLMMSFMNNTEPETISFRTIGCLKLQRHTWTAPPKINLPVGEGKCVLRNCVDTFIQHTTASFCMKLKIAGNFEILHFAPPAAWHQRNFIIFSDRVVIGGRFYAKQSAFCHVGRLQFRRFAEQNLKLIQVRTLTTPWQKWIFKVSNYTRNSTF